MKRAQACLGLAAIGLAVVVASALGQPHNELLKDEQHFLGAVHEDVHGRPEGGSDPKHGGRRAHGPRRPRFQRRRLGARGVRVCRPLGFPGLGQRKQEPLLPEPPESGVAVVDARTPDEPKVVATLQNPVGTSAEDVVVYTALAGPRAGHDIAAVGLQTCESRLDANADRGLMLWDVTNPAAPIQIGYLHTACCTRGIHEFEVEHRADLSRTFAYASVPTSRYPEDGAQAAIGTSMETETSG